MLSADSSRAWAYYYDLFCYAIMKALVPKYNPIVLED